MRIGTFEALARAGFAARGLLYLTIGWLALEDRRPKDEAETLRGLNGEWGWLLLALLALGFAGYGLWRLIEAITDTEGAGASLKGCGLRLGGAMSGLVHLLLGGYAAALALGRRVSPEGPGGGAEGGAATALELPGGAIVLVLATAFLVGAALHQLDNAVRLRFLRHLDSAAARQPAIAWAGRIGYAARGLVFGLIGFFLGQAALTARAGAAGGMADALAALPQWLQWLVAAGLILFGLFSLVEARFRRITDPHVLERLKAAAA